MVIMITAIEGARPVIQLHLHSGRSAWLGVARRGCGSSMEATSRILGTSGLQWPHLDLEVNPWPLRAEGLRRGS